MFSALCVSVAGGKNNVSEIAEKLSGFMRDKNHLHFVISFVILAKANLLSTCINHNIMLVLQRGIFIVRWDTCDSLLVTSLLWLFDPTKVNKLNNDGEMKN